MKRAILMGIGAIFLFSGCCSKLKWVECKEVNNTAPKYNPQPVIIKEPLKLENNTFNKKCEEECVKKFEAVGVGVIPCEGCSKAKKEGMARRAAILDAYKLLTEQLYGVKINGRDRVKDLVLQNSLIRAYTEGIIRGAKIVDESYKDGMYKVTMELKVNMEELKSLLNQKKDNYLE